MQGISVERPEKRFCVVSFPDEEETLYIVSNKWLKKGKAEMQQLCHWPPYKGDARVKRAVLEDESPASTWQTYTAKLLKKCKTYKGAESFVNAIHLVSNERSRLLHESEFGSCAAHPAKKIKREEDDTYQCDSRISESSSQSSSSVSPQSMCEVQQMTVDERTSSPIVSSVVCQKPHIASSSTYQFLLEATAAMDRTSEMISSREDENYDNCFSLEDKIDFIAKSLKGVKRNVSDILLSLQQDNSVYCPEELQNLPVESFEDLQNLNDKLADDKEFANMVKHLGLLGGKDPAEATRRVLSRLISHDVSIMLNWIGGKEKGSIQKFKRVIQLAIVAVRHNKEFADTSQATVEDCIKRWLRYAADRNGGRTRRKGRPRSVQYLDID